jgi:hypothetical protein
MYSGGNHRSSNLRNVCHPERTADFERWQVKIEGDKRKGFKIGVGLPLAYVPDKFRREKLSFWWGEGDVVYIG